VKAGEIFIFKPEFTSGPQTGGPRLQKEGDDPSLVLTARRSKTKLNVLGCLEVKFTAPGLGIQEVQRPIYWSEIDITGHPSDGAEGGEGVFDKQPIPLLRRTM
jgi:hypothetical protein